MIEEGMASWYGPGFNGSITANGEVYNIHELTAAHRTLPFNTLVLVKNVSNGKSVVVRINDRGPYVKSRIIDLSKKAARKIGMLQNGVARVKLFVAKRALNKSHTTDMATPTFTVQLGSFRHAKKAYQFSKKIGDSRVQLVRIDGHLWYRVYYGLYSIKTHAQQAEKRLERKGLHAFIQQIENYGTRPSQ